MTARRRILGVDYGAVRVGLAVCDRDRVIASPLTIYERRDAARDAQFFQKLAEAEEIGLLVLGLPLHLDGREGAKAAEARAFGAWLTATTGLAVVYWDERFTTVQAEAALWDAGLTHQKRRARRDSVAAQLLLQAYLDAGCPERPVLGALDEPTA